MSYIDNLRLVAANAGSGVVSLTGQQLTVLLNYISSIAATGTGDVMSDGSVPFTGEEDFQAGIKVDTISPSGTSGVSFDSQIVLKGYTTAQRDLLVTGEGAMVFNDDTDTIDYYDGAAWVSGVPSANPTFTGVVKIADGSAAAPSLTFTTDPDTGIILSAANSVGFVTNGVEKWSINSSGSLNPIADNTYDIGNGLVNPRDIQASRTLITGKASTTNGALTFQNSAGAATVTVAATGAKSVTIDNTGHDVEVGINGAAVSGVALYSAGVIRSATSLQVGDGSSTLSQPGADELLITASSGVSTSAGLTVGTTITTNAGSTNYSWGDVDNASPETQDKSIVVTINGNSYSIHATAL